MDRIPGDCIVFPAAPGRWLAYNVRSRTALGLDDCALSAWSRLSGDLGCATSELGGTTWETQRFTQSECSMHDPSRLVRDCASWGEGQLLHGAAFRDKLRRHHLISDDDEAYDRLFERPQHPLDRVRLGNFHDQLGRHLLFEKRTDPSGWWVAQKFVNDGSIRPDTAYGTVQWPALCSMFDREVRPGTRILDFGCGTGIYTVEMARRGAEAVGIDPSEAYLKKARARAHGLNCRFEAMALDECNGLGQIPSESFDTVFMSDALLFYFISVSPKENVSPVPLLKEIRRILRPNGRFISVEPHGNFYLAPWLGDERRPWTLLTEHRRRQFSTVPNFASLARVMLDAGFALTGLDELYRAPDRTSGDIRCDSFANEFPLWTLSIFTKQANATDVS